MTGVPVTSIFAGIFERLGFTVRLPYTFTGVIGDPASLSTGEKLCLLYTSIALTGRDGGAMGRSADVAVIVPETETYMIQELHLPVYHALCLMLEEHFFK